MCNKQIILSSTHEKKTITIIYGFLNDVIECYYVVFLSIKKRPKYAKYHNRHINPTSFAKKNQINANNDLILFQMQSNKTDEDQTRYAKF